MVEGRKTIKFGRYLLERRLAIGGMAEVFLGRIEGPEGFQKKVVIKRILPHLQADQNHVAMFLDEARLAARFDHPNLIQVYELALIDGQYCLAMEYLEGEDVAAILDESLRLQRKTPLEVAAYIVASAAEGLHYAHELCTDNGAPLNVVHRDISPANIIVTWRGGVKIVDFGIAKHEISASHTVAGTLKGKFSYMSPEQARGEVVDRRSDIFSLGTIFYELLTVTPCFVGSTQLEILDNVIAVRYRPVREVRPDLPRGVDAVLDRMLAPNRRDRFATAEEAREGLKEELLSGGLPLSSEVGRFLNELFGRPSQKIPNRVATAIHALDEVPVNGELSSPDVLADESSYRMLMESQKIRLDGLSLDTADTDSGVFEIRSGLLQPLRDAKRRSTLSKVADRLREPRYWPTTLLIIATSMALGAVALVMLYRAALGLPWTPQEIFNELVPAGAQEPADSEVLLTSTLQIVSEPAGASVTIDGHAVEGVTPLSIDNLEMTIPHQVGLELAGHQRDNREVVLTDTSPKILRVTLAPASEDDANTAAVRVLTDPPGAALVVDGNDATQVTPATLRLELGVEAELSASLKGYYAKAVTFTPMAGQDNVVTIPLVAAKAGDVGQLDLDSEPRSDVYLGERRLGSTPLKRQELPAGPVIVQLRNTKLGLSRTLRLDIPPGETLRRRVVFRKGQVAFDVRPWADVYLGKKKLGTTPMPPVNLFEGTYTFRLVNNDLGVERTVQVPVKGGKIKKVTEKLR